MSAEKKRTHSQEEAGQYIRLTTRQIMEDIVDLANFIQERGAVRRHREALPTILELRQEAIEALRNLIPTTTETARRDFMAYKLVDILPGLIFCLVNKLEET